MDTIETNIQLLVWSIKRSPEYKEYQRCQAALDATPELWPRVEKFCGDNFRLQVNKEDQIGEAMDRISEESKELRRIPEVNAYLQAELNLCRLIQCINLEIIGELDIHIPQL